MKEFFNPPQKKYKKCQPPSSRSSNIFYPPHLSTTPYCWIKNDQPLTWLLNDPKSHLRIHSQTCFILLKFLLPNEHHFQYHTFLQPFLQTHALIDLKNPNSSIIKYFYHQTIATPNNSSISSSGSKMLKSSLCYV